MKKLLLFGFVVSMSFVAEAEVMGTPEEEARWRKEAEEEVLAQEKAEAEFARIMGSIDLRPEQFVIMPRAFAKKIKPLQIREKEWRQLQDYQSAKNWSEMYALMNWIVCVEGNPSAKIERGKTPTAAELTRTLTSFSNHVYTLKIEWKDPALYHKCLYDGYAIYRPDSEDDYHLIQCNFEHGGAFREIDGYVDCRKSWDMRVSLAYGMCTKNHMAKVPNSITGGRYIIMPWAKKDRLDLMVDDEVIAISKKESAGEISRLEAKAQVEAALSKFKGEMLNVDNWTEDDRLRSLFPYRGWRGEDDRGVRNRNIPCLVLWCITADKLRERVYCQIKDSLTVFGQEWIVDGFEDREHKEIVFHGGWSKRQKSAFKCMFREEEMVQGEIVMRRVSDGKTVRLRSTKQEW